MVKLTENDWDLVRAAVDAMVDTLPEPDNVPEEDRADAAHDRAEYVTLQRKLAQ